MKYYILAIQKYADFSGRASRPEYWWFVLINVLIWRGCALIDGAVGFFNPQMGIGLLSGLYTLVMIIPQFSVGARRLHDTGRSAWWLLLGVVPILGIILLVFMLLKSQPDENRFGPNPHNHEAPDASLRA